MSDVVVVMCPPLCDYPEQPKDMSKCGIIDCPTCKGEMWVSEKKQELMDLSALIGNKIHLECYNCFKTTILNNPEMWINHVRVDI